MKNYIIRVVPLLLLSLYICQFAPISYASEDAFDLVNDEDAFDLVNDIVTESVLAPDVTADSSTVLVPHQESEPPQINSYIPDVQSELPTQLEPGIGGDYINNGYLDEVLPSEEAYVTPEFVDEVKTFDTTTLNLFYTLGDSFTVGGLTITVDDEISWDQFSNHFTGIGQQVAKVVLSIENIGIERFVFHFDNYFTTGPYGVLLGDYSLLFSDSLIRVGSFNPGVTKMATAALEYNDDGEYSIKFTVNDEAAEIRVGLSGGPGSVGLPVFPPGYEEIAVKTPDVTEADDEAAADIIIIDSDESASLDDTAEELTDHSESYDIEMDESDVYGLVEEEEPESDHLVGVGDSLPKEKDIYLSGEPFEYNGLVVTLYTDVEWSEFENSFIGLSQPVASLRLHIVNDSENGYQFDMHEIAAEYAGRRLSNLELLFGNSVLHNNNYIASGESVEARLQIEYFGFGDYTVILSGGEQTRIIVFALEATDDIETLALAAREAFPIEQSSVDFEYNVSIPISHQKEPLGGSQQ